MCKNNFCSIVFFYLNKHTASAFTLTGHLFLLLFVNMYTHKFKLFANIVYHVRIITSEVTNRWIFIKIKKNQITCKTKFIYSTPIIVFIYHCGHFPYYLLHLFTLLCFNISMISDWKYTPNLEMAVWSGDLPFLLMAVFTITISNLMMLCLLNCTKFRAISHSLVTWDGQLYPEYVHKVCLRVYNEKC